MSRYDPAQIEPRWQAAWDAAGLFAARRDPGRPKYYVLEMFPYPSGRIHIGHVRNYTMGDVVARYKRATGHNVLHPMGFDAFGLPAENAAIEKGVHPADWTYANIDAMRAQMAPLGLSLDWSRTFATCDPEYYGQQQALFLDMLEAGLIYRRAAMVNWDPVEMTVLANEQVVDGKGWRSEAPVERRELVQWFFRISDMAEELLEALDGLDAWPEKVKLMQRNWIGKSRGLQLSLRPDRGGRGARPGGGLHYAAGHAARGVVHRGGARPSAGPRAGGDGPRGRRLLRRVPPRRHLGGGAGDGGEAGARHGAAGPLSVRHRAGSCRSTSPTSC